MELFLVHNFNLVIDWERALPSFLEVKIFCDDILNFAECSTVSQPNRHGHMAVGINLVQSNRFG